MTRRAIGVSERPPLLQTIPLSLQHLFAMFGATVLVPILFHINPATVLLFNGIGTLLYLFICKGKIPAYLGSSFAFISPVLLLLPLGYEVALGGFIMCGVLFCLVSFIVKKAGTGWLDVMFPPAAMGAIVAVIGLELAGVAANMAGLLPADGQSPDQNHYYLDGDAGGDGVWFRAVPRLYGDYPDPDRRAGGLCALLCDGRGRYHPDRRGALVRAANLLHAAL
jgi:xanthine/uracil permease